MTGFTADWLALREPADRRARNRELVRDLTAWRRDLRELAVVDLGAGTGAALRYLAPRLGGEQTWLLLDHDAALLGLVEARTSDWARENGWQRVGELPEGMDCVDLVASIAGAKTL